jgi:hypothetical protein
MQNEYDTSVDQQMRISTNVSSLIIKPISMGIREKKMLVSKELGEKRTPKQIALK